MAWLASTEMVQFLRLHARDLDFPSTVMEARQFADVSVQSRPKKKVFPSDPHGAVYTERIRKNRTRSYLK